MAEPANKSRKSAAGRGARHALPTTFMDTLPDPTGKASALETFRALGWPTRFSEPWRQTNLRPIADQVYSLKADFDADAVRAAVAEHALDGHARFVFVNGAFDADLSAADTALPAGGVLAARSQKAGRVQLPGTANPAFEAIEALNEAYSRDGLQLRLPAGAQLSQPVQVIDVIAGDHVQAHLRHGVELADGSSAELVETVISVGASASDRLTTAIWRAAVADTASLSLARATHLDDDVDCRLQRIDVTVAADAAARIGSADLGGKLLRVETDVQLNAAGASADVAGAYLPAQRGHIDNHTTIDHAAAHTTSRELFRGVAAGRGKGVFNGRVVVRKDAQKVESDQQTRALLLTAGAEIAAKPELEIYADDVVCAHGNSVGQIDEAALFYLRSRGLPEAAARRVLIDSFLAVPLQQMPSEALAAKLRDALHRRVDAMLPTANEAAA